MISDEYLANLPDSPGVYLFKDEAKEILYVGKARSLKNRVGSYFKKGQKDSKTERLVRRVQDVSIVLTGNEKEAFLLENNLIKEHQPKYNMVLKDDKTYVSLRLSVQDKFPALTITRIIKDDGALYFGPHPHAKDAKDLMKVVQSIYPMRRCRESVFHGRTRPCILGGIDKCPAPCVDAIDEKSYRAIVDEIADFLMGKNDKLLKKLEEQIEEAAAAWNFEEARVKKEKYLAIKRLVEKQSVHEHMGINRDVWGFLSEEGRVRVVLLAFRKGRPHLEAGLQGGRLPQTPTPCSRPSSSSTTVRARSPTRSSFLRRSKTSPIFSSISRSGRKGWYASTVPPTTARGT